MGGACAWLRGIGSVAFVTASNSLPPDGRDTVNGVGITKEEVAAGIRVGAGTNATKTPSDPDSEEYKNFQRDMTAQMVSEEVEKQEATRRGITVASDEIDSIVQQVVEDKYLGSVQKMEDDFAKRGVTDEDLRNDILRQLLHKKFLQSLRDEVTPTYAEFLAQSEAYKKNSVYP